MKSFIASGRVSRGLDRVDEAVESFEEALGQHGNVHLEEFWTARCRNASTGSLDDLTLLSELVKAELKFRFDRGEQPEVTEYLQRFPALRTNDDRVLSLIYEEFCLSAERGHSPDVESYCDRYPRWKDSFVSQLEYHRVISQAVGKRPQLPAFPEPGENFEEFHLVSPMGAGGTSRVFLAKDLSLGGKQVVLKISLDRGHEPQVQGRLVHPHIVPVNSVTFQPAHRLRGLSMPFQPGLPLDVIIGRVNPKGRPRKAIALWHALVDGASKGLIPCSKDAVEALLREEIRRRGPRGDGWEGFPIRDNYPRGAAWIVMTIASALDHAHTNLTYHRDVKPANILLTLKHGPQLFDFNLAESPHSAERAEEALHGGTLPYMAPEQIQAFLNPDLWDEVGASADVYSLGLVLRELLTGQTPELPSEKLSPQRAMRRLLDRRPLLDVAVRKLNPEVPYALEAIVAKSLALEPQERYQSALAMAQDLERFLSDKPLLHAVNPSRPERMLNWAKRQRWMLVSAIGNVILVSVLGILLYPKIRVLLQAPVERRPEFQKALALIKAGQSSPALGHLSALADDYYGSPKFLFCLSIGLHANHLDPEAQTRFQQALEASNAESDLRELCTVNPELEEFLVRFAKERYKLEYLLGDDQLNPELRAPSFKLAEKALRLAEKIRPTDPQIQRRLARTDVFFGRFDAAHTRLTDLINRSRTTESAAEELFAAYQMRGWVSTRWVNSERSRPGESRRRTEEYLARMKQAEEDLTRSGNYRGGYGYTDREESQLKEYFLERDKLEAILTRCEVELDLGLTGEAERHLRHAEMALKRYREVSSLSQPLFESANATNKNLTQVESDALSKKLEDAKLRLRALQPLDHASTTGAATFKHSTHARTE
jgi:serine/threonine protein kinase